MELKITCPICNQAIDLDRDRCTNEDGKAAHTVCYLKRIAEDAERLAPFKPEHTAK